MVIPKEIDNIIQFLFNPVLPEWLVVIKIIFLSISLFAICFIIFVLFTTSWLKRLIIWDLKEYLTYKHYGLMGVAKKWAKIKERLTIGTESEAKLAIIEADDLLNNILKEMGFVGTTLEEKLEKITTDVLSNLKELKEAHNLRSNIIHDPTYRLELEEAKRALRVYEDALIELQAL